MRKKYLFTIVGVIVLAIASVVVLAHCSGGGSGASTTGGDTGGTGGTDGGDGTGGTDGTDGAGSGGPVVPGQTCATGDDGVTTEAVSYTGTFPATDGEHTGVTLTVNGTARTMYLYAPAGRGASPALFLVFHGTGGDGPDVGSRFMAMADAHGIVLAAPESRILTGDDWDQHYGGGKFWETIPPDDPARGCDPDRNPDLMLVRAIIQEATRVYHIDPTRIYTVGFSNGGFFSLTAAVALRDQIAAFAELSSGLVLCDNTNMCNFTGSGTTCTALAAEATYCTCSGAEKPITLPASGRMPAGYLSHGNQDTTVSVQYTCTLANRMQALGQTTSVTIRNGVDDNDHVMPDPMPEALWTFFAAHPRP